MVWLRSAYAFVSRQECACVVETLANGLLKKHAVTLGIAGSEKFRGIRELVRPSAINFVGQEMGLPNLLLAVVGLRVIADKEISQPWSR